jgi:hypothetical protein
VKNEAPNSCILDEAIDDQVKEAIVRKARTLQDQVRWARSGLVKWRWVVSGGVGRENVQEMVVFWGVTISTIAIHIGGLGVFQSRALVRVQHIGI